MQSIGIVDQFDRIIDNEYTVIVFTDLKQITTLLFYRAVFVAIL